MIHVRVVDDSPGATIVLTERTATALGFGDPARGFVGAKPTTRLWIEGTQVITAPERANAVPPKPKSDPKDEVATRYDLRGIMRTQQASSGVFAELYDTEPHALWYCDDDGPHHVWALPGGGNWEVVADGIAIVFDYETKNLVIVRGATGHTAIALPPQIDTDGVSFANQKRHLVWIPQQNAVVLVGKYRASIFDRDELLAVGDRADWAFHWIYPHGDATAIAKGIVTMAKWGRTNIEVDGRKISIGATPLTEGERVELRGLLWDRLSSTVYREIVRADGTRIPYPGAPVETSATTMKTTT